MYRHWAFARSTKVYQNQTSTPFTEPTQESKSSSSYMYCIFFFFFFYSPLGSFQKEKKNGCSSLHEIAKLAWNKKGWVPYFSSTGTQPDKYWFTFSAILFKYLSLKSEVIAASRCTWLGGSGQRKKKGGGGQNRRSVLRRKISPTP